MLRLPAKPVIICGVHCCAVVHGTVLCRSCEQRMAGLPIEGNIAVAEHSGARGLASVCLVGWTQRHSKQEGTSQCQQLHHGSFIVLPYPCVCFLAVSQRRHPRCWLCMHACMRCGSNSVARPQTSMCFATAINCSGRLAQAKVVATFVKAGQQIEERVHAAEACVLHLPLALWQLAQGGPSQSNSVPPRCCCD